MEATETTTRAEHLAWCKKRAIQYCEIGDTNQAYASMASDLGKHPDTAGHAAIQIGMMMLMGGHLSTPEKMPQVYQRIQLGGAICPGKQRNHI